MNIERYNMEGYADPTPYEAMRSRHGFRPIVYVCSPYSGDVERNTEDARRYCRYVLERGGIPYAPHLLFPQFMDDDDPEERSLALFCGSAMMSKCSEVWVFGDRISKGMQAEINHAARRYFPIRYITDDELEVAR